MKRGRNLRRVPWPLLEQILFPKKWEEEEDDVYEFGGEAGGAFGRKSDGTNRCEVKPLGVEERNLAYGMLNLGTGEKRQGEYTLEDYDALTENIRAECIYTPSKVTSL